MSTQKTLTARGYRGPGGGRASYVEAPPEWRGTSVQVCGLYPWIVGGGSPAIGVPTGRNISTGETVCFDPVSWFTVAKLLNNPSEFVLGLPALGKSTFIRRQVIGLAGMGVVPLILGDLKPDYVDVTRALGGQVIRLGRGVGSLNVLDVGALDQAADRMPAVEGARLREEAHGRRVNMVSALIVIGRDRPIDDHERAVLSEAIRVLSRRHQGVPVLRDLVQVLNEAPPSVREVALDRGDLDRYWRAVQPLQKSLVSLLDGPYGQVFANPTSERIRLDSPAVTVDVSGISANDNALKAAVLLACWSEGFGAVEGANALADAGVAPQRRFFIVLDELWSVLRAGEGLVDRVDELTRLNRQEGVAQAMITHSLADLRALRNENDREKARGFIERAGAVICGGLPNQELNDLAEVVSLTKTERQMVSSWSTPPGWQARSEPPGRGKFLIKVGQRPGIPVQVELTEAERASGVHDTNKRWTTDGH